jgi:hypothetical protein
MTFKCGIAFGLHFLKVALLSKLNNEFLKYENNKHVESMFHS